MSQLFDVELDQPSVLPGGACTGRLRVVAPGDVRHLYVELVRAEQSTKAPGLGPGVLATVVLCGARSVSPGDVFPFSIKVPASAAPAYRAPHTSLEWAIQGRADILGPDLTSHAPVEIAVDRERRPSDEALRQLAAGPDGFAASTKKSTMILAATFVAIGVAFALLTAYWAASPPEAWDGSKGALWFSGGMAAFLVACGTLVWWRTRPVDLVGVDLALGAGPFRRGDTVTVQVTNTSGGPIRVGRVALEWILIDRRVGKQRVIEHITGVIDDDWVDVPAGGGSTAFVVPTTTPPSFAGERIAVEHCVVALPPGTRSPIMARRRRSARFVVLP